MGTPRSLEDGYAYTDLVKKPSWTIMVYLAADSGLANFAVESLKQLSRSASEPVGDNDKADVVVVAQFSIDAPGGQEIKRYVFDGSIKKGLKGYEKDPLDERNNPLLSEREALEKFLNWVYEGRDSKKTDYYALILWSHGPELFLQPPLGGNTGDSASLYLTPRDLHDALSKSRQKRANKKLEIIGFDACSMSMFEMAYEIKDLAKLMIASQEEVPDASFPYSSIVQLFRQRGADVGALLDSLDATAKESERKSVPQPALVQSLQHAHQGLKNGVNEYLDAYQDYIVGKATGMKPVTLSILNLTQCDSLKEAIGNLACALLRAKDSDLPRRLIQARKSSQDYAGGLYVDLHDFCRNLSVQLDKTNGDDRWEAIRDECRNIQNLLKAPSSSPASTSVSPTPTPASLILINGAVTETGEPLLNDENKTANHGISIYLPYLTNRQFDDTVNRPLVKGGRGTNGGKGIPNALNAASGEYLMSTLQSLILATESYYGDLTLAVETCWYSFITTQWTNAINQTDPDPAFRYSRRQSDINAAASASITQRIASTCEVSA